MSDSAAQIGATCLPASAEESKVCGNGGDQSLQDLIRQARERKILLDGVDKSREESLIEKLVAKTRSAMPASIVGALIDPKDVYLCRNLVHAEVTVHLPLCGPIEAIFKRSQPYRQEQMDPDGGSYSSVDDWYLSYFEADSMVYFNFSQALVQANDSYLDLVGRHLNGRE